MDLQNIFALAAAIMASFCACQYCRLSFKNKIQPVLSMWLLFCVAVSLSFGAYICSDKHDLISDIGNTVDLGVVWATFITLAIIKRGQFDFNRFEIGCFIGSGLVLIFLDLYQSARCR